MSQQPTQTEWEYQWSRLEDRAEWLFWDWVWPNRPEYFFEKTVLDAGCGPGHHIRHIASKAKRVVGVDFNTSELARERTADLANVSIFKGDIAEWDNGERFDVVYSVGVIHHTVDPDRTVAHLAELLRPGGRLILWVYAREGNAVNRWFLEPVKSIALRHAPRWAVLALSHVLTALLYPIIYTVYMLRLPWLPFYEYFANFRKLCYQRNQLNVFDKLNAPMTHFISRAQAEGWMKGFEDVHIDPYVGVSWRVSGTKPGR